MTEADYAKIIVWVETDEFDETEGPEHYTGCDYHPVRQIIHFSYERNSSIYLSLKKVRSTSSGFDLMISVVRV